MIFNGGQILKVSSHFIGNQALDEHVMLTKMGLELNDPEMLIFLSKHFLDPMRESHDVNYFSHDIELTLHELNYLVQQIFSSPESFHEYSRQIAELLQGKSTHPRISPGELYVVFFKDCITEGEVVNAIGLFKVDTKQQFLKSGYKNGDLTLSIESGTVQKKIDKGALIFDINQQAGYKVVTMDKKSQAETRFWSEEFLKIKPASTAYSETQNLLTMAKEFVTSKLPEEFKIDKAEQVDLLNRSVDYFKGNDQYNEEEFASAILGNNEDAKQSLRDFKHTFQESRAIKFSDEFEISDAAVKKTAKVLKKVIKLDKNFDVYIHGDKDLIERGVDPVSGKKFYKIYFDQES